MLTHVIILRCFNYCHILVVYLNELTLSVCVWRWSCNLLRGRRCLCRWARGWLAMEWGTTMRVLVVLFIVVFFTKKYGLFL